MAGKLCVVHGNHRVLARIGGVIEEYYPLQNNYVRVYNVLQANEKVREILHAQTRKNMPRFFFIRFGSLVECCEFVVEFEHQLLSALETYGASAGGLSAEELAVKSILQTGDFFHFARTYIYLTEGTVCALRVYDSGALLGGFVIASVLLVRDDLERRLEQGGFPAPFALEILRVYDAVWELRLTSLDTIAAKGSLISILLLRQRDEDVDWERFPDPLVDLPVFLASMARSSITPPGFDVDVVAAAVQRDWAMVEKWEFSEEEKDIVFTEHPAFALSSLPGINAPNLQALNHAVQLIPPSSSIIDNFFARLAAIERSTGAALTPAHRVNRACDEMRVRSSDRGAARKHDLKKQDEMVSFCLELLPDGRAPPVLSESTIAEHAVMFARATSSAAADNADTDANYDVETRWEDVVKLEAAHAATENRSATKLKHKRRAKKADDSSSDDDDDYGRASPIQTRSRTRAREEEERERAQSDEDNDSMAEWGD